MTKILNAVSGLLSYNNDGSVNWETSFTTIQNAVEGEIRENLSYDAAISAALDRLFNKLPAGTRVKTDIAVQACAADLCGGDILQMVEVSARIENFLERSSRFVSKRGRSGGLFRVA